MLREILAGNVHPGWFCGHISTRRYRIILKPVGAASHFYITSTAMCMIGEHGIQATRSVEEITVGNPGTGSG